jgi:sec-independent protein translocase protein TatB
VPDIGLGELIVIAILALLVFGPDRLPKVAADAARTLRQVRQMATAARRDLADAAGLEKDPELAAAVRELRDLDPRRVLEPLDEAPAKAPAAYPATSSSGTGTGSGPAAPATSAPVQPAAPHAVEPAVPGPTEGAADGGTAATARGDVDPDWT